MLLPCALISHLPVTAVPLFVTCGDISPRRGENLSLPGEAFRGKLISVGENKKKNTVVS